MRVFTTVRGPSSRGRLSSNQLTSCGLSGATLPAAFIEQSGQLRPWLCAQDLRAAKTLPDLITLVRQHLPERV